jgi:hypothetical protein
MKLDSKQVDANWLDISGTDVNQLDANGRILGVIHFGEIYLGHLTLDIPRNSTISKLWVNSVVTSRESKPWFPGL